MGTAHPRQGPPARPQTGHNRTWGHLHTGSRTAQSGREGREPQEERRAEVTASEHGGERKCCQQEGYCVAMRVPFVLIKKDRRSEPQLSHAKKC